MVWDVYSRTRPEKYTKGSRSWRQDIHHDAVSAFQSLQHGVSLIRSQILTADGVKPNSFNDFEKSA